MMSQKTWNHALISCKVNIQYDLYSSVFINNRSALVYNHFGNGPTLVIGKFLGNRTVSKVDGK